MVDCENNYLYRGFDATKRIPYINLPTFKVSKNKYN